MKIVGCVKGLTWHRIILVPVYYSIPILPYSSLQFRSVPVARGMGHGAWVGIGVVKSTQYVLLWLVLEADLTRALVG